MTSTGDTKNNSTLVKRDSKENKGADIPAKDEPDNSETIDVDTQLRTYLDPLVEDTGRLICYENTWLLELFIPNQKKLDAVKNFRLDKADIIVASFPKSGTTWTQEIVVQLLSCCSSGNVCGQDERIRTLEETFPFLEAHWTNIDDVQKMPSPKLIKTHLPYSKLPQNAISGKAKVIYVARNPKDIVVSYYFFSKLFKFVNFKGNLDDAFIRFVQGKVMFGPWLDHVLSYWQHKMDHNLLFLTYEELHENLKGAVERIADFIGCSPLSSHQMETVMHETSFQVMKRNPKTNKTLLNELEIFNPDNGDFMRKGVVGDWKNYLTSEMNDVIEKTCLDPLDPVLRQRLSA